MDGFKAAGRLILKHRVAGWKQFDWLPYQLLREGERDLRASGRELIEQRLRVAHATRRLTGNERESLFVHLHVLGSCDLFQACNDLVDGHAAELVTLTARKHRGGICEFRW